MRLITRLFVIGTLSLSAFSVTAGEGGLYVTPPPGSAFVRVFNLQPAKAIGAVSVGKSSLSRVEPGRSSDFAFMDANTKSIKIDDKDIGVSLKEGAFYSLAYDGSEVKVIDNEALTDKRKALLHLVNLTAETLDLKTVKGDISIIPSVASNASGARAINPAKIPFGVFAGTTKLLETTEIYLDRGRSGSLFVFKSGDAYKYIWVDDKLATEK